MIRDILLTAGVVLTAAFLIGLGWWHADRRGRDQLAEVRATLTGQLDESERDCKDLSLARVALSTQLAGTRRELDEMTRAHHRGQYEYERLLEAWREVPEAFRAPLRVLDERRDIITPVEMLFDAYDVPRPDVDAAEAVRLAAIIDAPTDVWKRVIYRTPGTGRPTATATWDTGTVHDGELLDPEEKPVGRALVPVKSYPAQKQRHGKGKRR